MEQIFTDIHWLAVLLSTLAAFSLGGIWYSKFLFEKLWKRGIGTPAVSEKTMQSSYMYSAMAVQFVATFFLAIVASVTILLDLLWLFALFTITLIGFVKANGFYAGKTKTAISIEVSYLFLAAVALYVIQTIFY